MGQEQQNVVAAAVVALATVIQGLATWRSGHKTRERVGLSQKSVETQIAELRGICIGADGKNGLRGDIAEVKQDIRDIKKAAHDRNDRLHGEIAGVAAEVSEIKADVARIDERTKGAA